MDRPSPEEKLLHLIKNAAGKSSRKKKQADIQKTKQSTPAESLARPKKIAVHTGQIKKLKIPTLDLKFINKALRILLVIISLFFIFEVVYSRREISQVYKQGLTDEKDLEFASFPKTLQGEFSDYLPAAARRDIFISSGRRTGLKGTGITMFNAEEYVSKLKLLGIISGARPQAIVEDQNENKNYNLSVGDYLKGFLVEEVGSGKISFDYKGEKFDLFL